MTAVATASPGRAVLRLARHRMGRGGLVVAGLVTAGTAVVAVTFVTAGDALDPASIAALAANPAIRTLFGEPVALDTAGGFTVWRTGTALAVLAAVWAVLTATGATRGEEQAGRWDLLLAGRLPIDAVVRRHLAVLAAAAALIGAGATAALLAAGAGGAGAVLHGLGLLLVTTFFAAVGGLAAQVLGTRGAAATLGVGLVGAGLLARMVGDGLPALSGLRWVSPFGLLALAEPYGANRTIPLVVLAVATAALLVAAPAAASHRDLHGAWIPPAPARRSPSTLLRSPAGFAVHRTRGPVAAWGLGVAAFLLLVGLVAGSLVEFLGENPRFAELAAAAGFPGLGTVEGYAAALLTLLAVAVGAFPAARLAELAGDERSGRLALLYARALTRSRLLGVMCAVTAAGAAALAGTGALALWAGAGGAGLSLRDALAGAANTLPVAALGLGCSVLALGWAPRAVAVVGALPAVGGFLLLVLARSAGAPQWVSWPSPFAHLAAVPATPPDLRAAAVLVAVALALGLAGAAGYARRDLQG
jgi:ABC-2 type transport system permease protein